jgi:hypothetical protein
MNKPTFRPSYRIVWDDDDDFANVGPFPSFEAAASHIAHSPFLMDQPGVHIQRSWTSDWENDTA